MNRNLANIQKKKFECIARFFYTGKRCAILIVNFLLCFYFKQKKIRSDFKISIFFIMIISYVLLYLLFSFSINHIKYAFILKYMVINEYYLMLFLKFF